MVNSKKKTAFNREELCTHNFEISEWEPSYGLLLNKETNLSNGPSKELFTFKVMGFRLRLEHFAGRKLKVFVFGDRELSEKLKSPENYESATP